MLPPHGVWVTEATQPQDNAISAVSLQTILGHGIDNHLLGLKQIADETGRDCPDLFTDESYRIANRFILTTSQASVRRILFPSPAVYFDGNIVLLYSMYTKYTVSLRIICTIFVIFCMEIL